MDTTLQPQSQLQTQPQCQENINNARPTAPMSPEFEFWGSSAKNQEKLNLVDADELFVDGVLLPLDKFSISSSGSTDPAINTSEPAEPGLTELDGPENLNVSVSSSKRWRDIFKLGDKKIVNGAVNKSAGAEKCVAVSEKGGGGNKKKDRERERKSNGSGGAAELNINIWPFSRSHSAGNSGSRPKLSSSGGGSVSRKVSSAPCSRSNSSGESRYRRLPNSPGRPGGIHLGRNSPVWQVKPRGVNGAPVNRSNEKSRMGQQSLTGQGGAGVNPMTKTRVMNINVQTCIGYRSTQVSCKSEVAASEDGCAVSSGNGGKLFNLRTLFTKKVY